MARESQRILQLLLVLTEGGAVNGMHSFDVPPARARMIDQQLRRRGISSERVLAAMARVPRELFVPADLAEEAYGDCALPIDCEQTISQPLIVAMMTEALRLEGEERVLEIGTGSGYQTAILALLAREIYSVERHAELSRQARERLEWLEVRNAKLRVGDGSLGWPEAAPFDRVILTAAAEKCPPEVWDQLAEGGILVGPFGPPNEQVLTASRKIGGAAQTDTLTSCRFVPLVSAGDKTG